MEKETIKAVLRLEKAGREDNLVTKKLHQAAKNVAGFIKENVPENVLLPRGYLVKPLTDEGGYYKCGSYLVWTIEGVGKKRKIMHWIDSDFETYEKAEQHHIEYDMTPQTRTGSLLFAKDISEGLLDEISKFLENRTAKTIEATNVLLAHKKEV